METLGRRRGSIVRTDRWLKFDLVGIVEINWVAEPSTNSVVK
jgi:hypothetical protein